MVTHDRGQVLLVGAVVLALTLIAIVTLLNGVAYTEHVGGGDQDAYDDAERIERSVARDLGAMSAAVADGSASASQAELQAATTTYGSRMSEMTASSHAAAVTVEFDAATAEGTAIVHDDPSRAFIPNNGFAGTGASWQPVKPSERDPIESLDVSFETSEIPQPPPSPPAGYEPFSIEITDHSSSVTRTLQVSRTSVSSVAVDVDSDGDGSFDTTCSFVAGPRVRVDLIKGDVAGQSCSFLSLADTTSDYSVTIHGAGPYTPSNFRYPEGTYKIVLSTPGAVSSSHPRYDDSAAPHARTEVEKARYTFVYETPSMTYESTIEVEVDEP